ncbi:MAG: hypothetical protein LBJ75_04285 [Puniceicoccales bacterium]|jgi:hypothetical protein|nr:hypothetical protein [Puniceicoccales bacterium]
MSIQNGNSYGDIRSFVQDVGKEAIQLKGGPVVREIKTATKDYTIEATFNPKTRQVFYKMTSLDARGVEHTESTLTEKIGLLGRRHVGGVERGMVSRLQDYSVADFISHGANNASGIKEKTETACINGQQYKVTTGCKGENGTVSVTLTVLDKTGRAVRSQKFECSNGKIDKEDKKTIAKFEQNVRVPVLLKNNRLTLEKVVADLRSSSISLTEAAKIIEECKAEIFENCPDTGRLNTDTRSLLSKINKIRIAINMKEITPNAAANTLEGNLKEFKALNQGRRISDLVGVINDSKISKGHKLATRRELAKIVGDVIKSDDLTFVNAMGALPDGLMRLAIKHGIDKGRDLEFLQSSQTLLGRFKNENIDLGARKLAMVKLSLLHTAGFYGKELRTNITRAAQEFTANLAFLGIASLNGQGKEFAQKLQSELSRLGLPTDGNLFVDQRTDVGESFLDEKQGGSAAKKYEFSVGELRVIVAEQKALPDKENPKKLIIPCPHICILDGNGQPLHAEYRMGQIVIAEDEKIPLKSKLEQLQEIESKLSLVPSDLGQLGESCTDIVNPEKKLLPGGQNFTRPSLLADASKKEQQKLQKN